MTGRKEIAAKGLSRGKGRFRDVTQEGVRKNRFSIGVGPSFWRVEEGG